MRTLVLKSASAVCRCVILQHIAQGVDSATNSLVYSCGCLSATATAAQQAAARVAADEVATATVQQRRQADLTAVLAPGVADPAGLTSADVFNLHSKPDSKYKLVLDFNGNVLNGSVWNELKKLDKIVTPPYDKGGRWDGLCCFEFCLLAVERTLASLHTLVLCCCSSG
jgi:hypothetical protein